MIGLYDSIKNLFLWNKTLSYVYIPLDSHEKFLDFMYIFRICVFRWYGQHLVTLSNLTFDLINVFIIYYHVLILDLHFLFNVKFS